MNREELNLEISRLEEEINSCKKKLEALDKCEGYVGKYYKCSFDDLRASGVEAQDGNEPQIIKGNDPYVYLHILRLGGDDECPSAVTAVITETGANLYALTKLFSNMDSSGTDPLEVSDEREFMEVFDRVKENLGISESATEQEQTVETLSVEAPITEDFVDQMPVTANEALTEPVAEADVIMSASIDDIVAGEVQSEIEAVVQPEAEAVNLPEGESIIAETEQEITVPEIEMPGATSIEDATK